MMKVFLGCEVMLNQATKVKGDAIKLRGRTLYAWNSDRCLYLTLVSLIQLHTLRFVSLPGSPSLDIWASFEL